jgi:hypothetical protein
MFDPYLGVAAGFRLGLMRWTPFDAAAGMQSPQSGTWPGAVAELRVGLDYHPTPRYRGWQVGAMVSGEVTVAKEQPSGGGPVPSLALFGGLRSTIQF